MAAKVKDLTPLQKRFVQEYIIDLNATAAYQRAGYSAKGHVAESAASRLLSNVEVAKAIEEAAKRVAAKAELAAGDVLAEIDLLATSDISELFDMSGDNLILRKPHEIPKKAWRCVGSIKVRKVKDGEDFVEMIEFKLWDKVASLRLAAQRRGLLIDKLEATGKDGAPITVVEIVKSYEGKESKE